MPGRDVIALCRCFTKKSAGDESEPRADARGSLCSGAAPMDADANDAAFPGAAVAVGPVPRNVWRMYPVLSLRRTETHRADRAARTVEFGLDHPGQRVRSVVAAVGPVEAAVTEQVAREFRPACLPAPRPAREALHRGRIGEDARLLVARLVRPRDAHLRHQAPHRPREAAPAVVAFEKRRASSSAREWRAGHSASPLPRGSAGVGGDSLIASKFSISQQSGGSVPS